MTKRTVEIFAPGSHTAMCGTTIKFTADDIAAMASGYDRALFDAPAVVGHPKHDGPAYAWTEGLSVKDGKLVATITDIDPGFEELVSAKRFKKISAAFYAPDDAANPKPGTYYLRHIGFLGAAAPAVKGLKSVEFAGDAEKVLEFADLGDLAWPLSGVARMFRGFRDFIIEKFDLETADRVLPNWDITNIEEAATKLRPEPRLYSEHTPENPNVKTEAQRIAELEAREAAVAQRETTVNAQVIAFSEAETSRRAAGDAALVEELEAGGRIAPALRTELLNFMGQLDAGKTLAFGEGEGAQQMTAHAFFTDLLKNKTGKLITFAEVSAGGETPGDLPSEPAARGAEIGRRAIAFIEESKAKGVIVTHDAAVAHVLNQEK